MIKIITGLLVALLALQSCTVTKKTSRQVSRDTVVTVVHDTLINSHIDSFYSQVHDTIITTPGGTVTDTYTAAQLTPVYQEGRKIAHTYTTGTGNLHQSVTIDTTGRITITCHEDSLQLVIQNLQRQVTLIRDSVKTAMQASTARSSYEISDNVTVKSSFIEKLKNIEVGLFIAIAIFLIYKIYRLLNPVEKNPLL